MACLITTAAQTCIFASGEKSQRCFTTIDGEEWITTNRKVNPIIFNAACGVAEGIERRGIVEGADEASVIIEVNP
jgi:hypothetical protein